jgi:hypothetical protein
VANFSERGQYDMIFTRAGSASALSRSAICRASSSLIGPAATGAQHTGADMARRAGPSGPAAAAEGGSMAQYRYIAAVNAKSLELQ